MHTVLMLVNIGGKEENVASLVQHASSTCDDHSAIRKSSSQALLFCFLFLLHLFLSHSSHYMFSSIRSTALRIWLFIVASSLIHVTLAVDSENDTNIDVKSPAFWGQIVAIIALVICSGIVAGKHLSLFKSVPLFFTMTTHPIFHGYQA